MTTEYAMTPIQALDEAAVLIQQDINHHKSTDLEHLTVSSREAEYFVKGLKQSSGF